MKKNLNNVVIAERGFHLKYPENTIPAITQAISQNFAVEVECRRLKCGTIVCFNDRYMKRLLNIPGRIENMTYDKLKKYRVQGSKYNVPTLAKVLSAVGSKKTILIHVKGKVDDEYLKELQRLLSNYQENSYFYSYNLKTYYKLKKVFGEESVLFPFGMNKVLKVVRGKDYKKVTYVPTVDNILVTVEDSAQKVIREIYRCFNKYNTRVKKDHWLISYNGKKYQTQHRGIYDPNLLEHSSEAYECCIRHKKAIELDVARHDGKIICYHSDRISAKLGQKSSISEKKIIDDSLTFKEALRLINGRVPVIIDIKDFNLFSRAFEKSIVKELEGYDGEFACQSFNPLVNIFFMRNYPQIIRGQVGHSLNGIKKLRKVLLTIVNFVLFYIGKPDYIVYDLDEYVHLLSKYNNILGLPVIGYTATKEEDIELYADFFDNILVEGDFLDKEK